MNIVMHKWTVKKDLSSVLPKGSREPPKRDENISEEQALENWYRQNQEEN